MKWSLRKYVILIWNKTSHLFRPHKFQAHTYRLHPVLVTFNITKKWPRHNNFWHHSVECSPILSKESSMKDAHFMWLLFLVPYGLSQFNKSPIHTSSYLWTPHYSADQCLKKNIKEANDGDVSYQCSHCSAHLTWWSDNLPCTNNVFEKLQYSPIHSGEQVQENIAWIGALCQRDHPTSSWHQTLELHTR